MSDVHVLFFKFLLMHTLSFLTNVDTHKYHQDVYSDGSQGHTCD